MENDIKIRTKMSSQDKMDTTALLGNLLELRLPPNSQR
jgi:hypothetical protein